MLVTTKIKNIFSVLVKKKKKSLQIKYASPLYDMLKESKFRRQYSPVKSAWSDSLMHELPFSSKVSRAVQLKDRQREREV